MDTSLDPHSQPRVLVVDDHDDTRQLLGYVLGRCGLASDLYADPHRALEQVPRADYAGYIVDISLGADIDGFDVLRRIRQVRSGREEAGPVIAVTAHALPGDERRCLEAGFDAYVSKPFTSGTICSVLHANGVGTGGESVASS